jgi:hypothetical protein
MPSGADPAERLRAHLRQERQLLDPHPSPERVAAYHERLLSAEESEQVREHLAACPDCTAELLALAALPDGEGEEEISARELDEAWRRLAHPSAPAVVDLPRPSASRAPAQHLPWATAAVLGLAAALLAFVVVDQRQTIARLAEPRINPPLASLEPVDSVRQGLRAVPELALPAEAERVWIILNPAADLAFPSYEIEILAPDGTLALRFRDLQPTEAGNFRLEVPRSRLRAGSCRLLLSGVRSGERHRLEEFALTVRIPEGMGGRSEE